MGQWSRGVVREATLHKSKNIRGDYMFPVKTIKKSDVDIDKFWKNVSVDKPYKCWEWIGAKGNGYGKFYSNGKQLLAHRVSWVIHNGKLPKRDGNDEPLFVCHKCDNPGCVNPDHLYLGTHFDNMQDRIVSPKSHNKGEKHGLHKVGEKEVLEMRSKYIRNVYTLKMIAAEYDISYVEVHKIITRKTWRHLKQSSTKPAEQFKLF